MVISRLKSALQVVGNAQDVSKTKVDDDQKGPAKEHAASIAI